MAQSSREIYRPAILARLQGGGPSSPVGSGLEGAGAAVALQPPDDKGEADDEPPGELVQRALVSLHGVKHALSEIVGRGGHGSPPHQDLRPTHVPTDRWPLGLRGFIQTTRT